MAHRKYVATKKTRKEMLIYVEFRVFSLSGLFLRIVPLVRIRCLNRDGDTISRVRKITKKSRAFGAGSLHREGGWDPSRPNGPSSGGRRTEHGRTEHGGRRTEHSSRPTKFRPPSGLRPGRKSSVLGRNLYSAEGSNPVRPPAGTELAPYKFRPALSRP